MNETQQAERDEHCFTVEDDVRYLLDVAFWNEEHFKGCEFLRTSGKCDCKLGHLRRKYEHSARLSDRPEYLRDP